MSKSRASPIRAESFDAWFKTHLAKDYASAIAEHGADAGYPHITYTHDCARLFDRFADEIWTMAVEDSEDQGYMNVAELIAQFKRDDMFADWAQFRNLMVWYACEKLAHAYVATHEVGVTP